MNDEWMIRPILAKEAAEAMRVILGVAYEMMAPGVSLEEFAAEWDTRGVLDDMTDVQKNYVENGGVFLVMVSGGKIVGTGAFQRYAEGVGIVRRIALLHDYRGQGFGYEMMRELIRLARSMNYSKMCLWTDRYKLARSVAFYHQLGFAAVPHEGAYENEFWMEMVINPLD